MPVWKKFPAGKTLHLNQYCITFALFFFTNDYFDDQIIFFSIFCFVYFPPFHPFQSHLHNLLALVLPRQFIDTHRSDDAARHIYNCSPVWKLIRNYFCCFKWSNFVFSNYFFNISNKLDLFIILLSFFSNFHNDVWLWSVSISDLEKFTFDVIILLLLMDLSSKTENFYFPVKFLSSSNILFSVFIWIFSKIIYYYLPILLNNFFLYYFEIKFLKLFNQTAWFVSIVCDQYFLDNFLWTKVSINWMHLINHQIVFEHKFPILDLILALFQLI